MVSFSMISFFPSCPFTQWPFVSSLLILMWKKIVVKCKHRHRRNITKYHFHYYKCHFRHWNCPQPPDGRMSFLWSRPMWHFLKGEVIHNSWGLCQTCSDWNKLVRYFLYLCSLLKIAGPAPVFLSRHIIPVLNPDGYEYSASTDRFWRYIADLII